MFIGIPEIMKELNVGRPTATRLAKAYLGKRYSKRGWIRVPKDAFIAWINNGNF